VESRYANAWYYLFSSVPQTFAAAFALLFAFTIYRLQHLEQSIASITTEIHGFFNRIRQLERYATNCEAPAARGDWEAYLQGMTHLFSDPNVTEAAKAQTDHYRSLEFAELRVKEIRKLLELVRKCWPRLWQCFVLTGALIVVTTTLIPLGYWVSSWVFALSWILTGIVTIATIVLYFQLACALLPFREQRLTAYPSTVSRYILRWKHDGHNQTRHGPRTRTF
jgi:hypothetical protein